MYFAGKCKKTSLFIEPLSDRVPLAELVYVCSDYFIFPTCLSLNLKESTTTNYILVVVVLDENVLLAGHNKLNGPNKWVLGFCVHTHSKEATAHFKVIANSWHYEALEKVDRFLIGAIVGASDTSPPPAQTFRNLINSWHKRSMDQTKLHKSFSVSVGFLHSCFCFCCCVQGQNFLAFLTTTNSLLMHFPLKFMLTSRGQCMT